MRYSIREIASICQATFLNDPIIEGEIEHVCLDSRQVVFPASSIFLALKGRQLDGHDFIKETYKNGIRHFLISERIISEDFPSANFLYVSNTFSALHQLAKYHRGQYQLPVIGITGSNGKTVIKEWLYQLLHPDYHIVRSPKSYNSQTGVPLSVLQIKSDHHLGIFEAGISQMGEMERLSPIIDPEIGILSNIGAAHSEGFPDKATKLREKLKLFDHAKILIYRSDDELINTEINLWQESNHNAKTINWSTKGKPADYNIQEIRKQENVTTLEVIHSSRSETKLVVELPFTDDASIENACHCCIVMLHLGINTQMIAERFKKLEPVALRLELKAGSNGCLIINDSYNSDLNSLEIALNFLGQQSKTARRTLILSDILQSGLSEVQLYEQVANLVKAKNIDRLIGIGKSIQTLNTLLSVDFEKQFYDSTASFLENLQPDTFQDESILLKGARQFGFEKIADRLSRKIHRTVLEVNLTALLNNLRVYQSHLLPGTKLMVMVKAAAYGSGSAQVAKLLEFQHVDYLAVAYADEGVELRSAGIQLPILVLNPEEATFDSIIRYQLEPEIYSFSLLKKFLTFLKAHDTQSSQNIHIKFDTGMHRLGFDQGDLAPLSKVLKDNRQHIAVKSVLSHLAASDDATHDEFSKKQIDLFQNMYESLTAKLGYHPDRHILNSGGIIRFPESQLEMVRLGIGLYGIDTSGLVQDKLQTVLTLKTTISQIKEVPQGHTIGYGRMGTAEQSMKVATLGIGYADGLLRKAGNGAFAVLVNGRRAPIIGNVCMDMTMADVTHIPDIEEGHEAIIFGVDSQGNSLPVKELASCYGTIPYEVFTSVSNRVKRVYIQE